MGLLEELKKLTKPYDDEDFLEDDLADPAAAPAQGQNARSYASYAEAPRQAEPPRRSPFQAPQQRAAYAAAPQQQRAPYAAQAPAYQQPPAYQQEGNVVSFGAPAPARMLLVKPDRFEAAADIADKLQEKNAVVLNLETTPKDTARRLIDFLSGVTYALNGKIKKVAGNTYVITPVGMDFMGDSLEEMETKSNYF